MQESNNILPKLHKNTDMLAKYYLATTLVIFSKASKKLCKLDMLVSFWEEITGGDRMFHGLSMIIHVLPEFTWTIFLSCNKHLNCICGVYVILRVSNIQFGDDHLMDELEVWLHYYVMQCGQLLCILSSCNLYYGFVLLLIWKWNKFLL